MNGGKRHQGEMVVFLRGKQGIQMKGRVSVKIELCGFMSLC